MEITLKAGAIWMAAISVAYLLWKVRASRV
jgi:hypothetical protein